ncbi:uroporphyrinogen-III synthase [Lecanora helva]
MNPPIPILLLKSPSPTPSTDPYATHLTSPSSSASTRSNPHTYTPHYIPVLTHTLLPDPLISLLLTHLQSPSPSTSFPYGALLLTSQRAVAALTTAINAPPIQNRLQKLQELEFDFYTVGPATERALIGVRERCLPRCRIFGGERAGSGEVLGRIMLGRVGGDEEGRYGRRVGDGRLKAALFLTGEKRRDVLPRMLMDEGLGEMERVQVDEMLVYETSELEEFGFGFGKVLRDTENEARIRWVVVFSPTAGRGMLAELGWLDEGTGRVRDGFEKGGRRTFVCCIGPTTRQYLETEFGFQADVVADKPSPQGVQDGIERYMDEKGL